MAPPIKTSKRAGAECPECPGTVHGRQKSRDRHPQKVAMLARDGGACVWCATPIEVATTEADRIVAGGRYTRANLVSSCMPCNRRRSETPWQAWLAQCADPKRALALIMSATGGREPHAHLR